MGQMKGQLNHSYSSSHSHGVGLVRDFCRLPDTAEMVGLELGELHNFAVKKIFLKNNRECPRFSCI